MDTNIKKIVKKSIAVMMTFIILGITPMNDLSQGLSHLPSAAKAETGAAGDGKYISEFKVGMGETADEAKKELENEGYTILKDDDGNYADLNDGAGSKSAFKEGANDKIVYLGYKTTSDPNDAVTDLAVMNMNGGYDVNDYKLLMNKCMNSQIKPFVDRFIATLEEYRENYKKPKSSMGHIRADYMRRMMNRITDDDTGGKPMGDLLLNKTKYELGDAAYNALSDSEKKNHADILTILMQGNGQSVLLLETLLTKATDTSDDTWVDRFLSTTPDDLEERIMEENPNLKSHADVLAQLDKQYYDTASGLLNKWDDFRDVVLSYEDTAAGLTDSIEEAGEAVDSTDNIDAADLSMDDANTLVDANSKFMKTAYDAEKVGVCAYLETLDYDGGSLIDFFSKDKSEFSSKTGIRSLYPLVDALTPGQIAGLDFVSFTELFVIASADENTYKDTESFVSDVKEASIYENVDREIYEDGGVALTSEKLRQNALSKETDPEDYRMSNTQIILWGVVAGCIVGSIGAGAIANHMSRVVSKNRVAYEILDAKWDKLSKQMAATHASPFRAAPGTMLKVGMTGDMTTILRAQSSIPISTTPTNIVRALSTGMAVAAVILTVLNFKWTLEAANAYYRTDFKLIPGIMVDEADITAYDEDGTQIVIKNQTAYYRAVKCNRKEGSTDIEKNNYKAMRDLADLNGDIGRQWLALYAVKYTHGMPILADSLKYTKNNDSIIDGYTTGIHEFGSKAAANLNKKAYLFPDNPPTIKVFYKTADKTVSQTTKAGSVFSPGSLALGGGVGMVIGALLAVLIMRRKRSTVTKNQES